MEDGSILLDSKVWSDCVHLSKLFSASERGQLWFLFPLGADLDVRHKMWPTRNRSSSSAWGRAMQSVCLLKYFLSWQHDFTASHLACDPWACHGPEVRWAWHKDLWKGGRLCGSSCGVEWPMVEDYTSGVITGLRNLKIEITLSNKARLLLLQSGNLASCQG